MNTLIVLLNFLLLTLILYNIINSKTMEYFKGCSGSSSNAVYRQQSETDKLTGQINSLIAKFNTLNTQSNMNKGLIGSNTILIQGKVKEVKGEADKMGKELDDIDSTEKKEWGSISPGKGTPKIHSGKPIAGKRFGGSLRGSSSAA